MRLKYGAILVTFVFAAAVILVSLPQAQADGKVCNASQCAKSAPKCYIGECVWANKAHCGKVCKYTYVGCPDSPPAVSSSHSPPSPATSQIVTITASATDDIGLSSASIFVDGVSVGSCSVSGKSASCQKTVGPYSAAGSHTYYAKAVDTKGQTSQSSMKSFTIINTLDDPNNCGSVGNVCAGGVCTNGVCGDYALALSPSGGLANAGDLKTVNTTLTLTTGSAPAVSLSASGLPTGTSASFSPVSCTPTCYSNGTITTTATTPEGSHLISISGTSGSVVKTATYNLTVLSSSCNLNGVCNYPETQTTCAADCATTADIPSPVAPGEVVTVTIEFYDFRYTANGKVRIDLLINPEGTSWTPSNGCFFGGKKMGPTAGGGAIAWPSGTVSENGHFKIETSCTIPSTITAGAHTLVATPTIF